MPSTAWRTGSRPAADATVDSIPMLRAGMWSTIKTAAGRSAGNAPRIALSGPVAPDEPPITIISRLLIGAADIPPHG
jgi:hypothetical protein